MKAFLISPFKVAREVNLRRVEHASASLSKGLEKINQQAQPIFGFSESNMPHLRVYLSRITAFSDNSSISNKIHHPRGRNRVRRKKHGKLLGLFSQDIAFRSNSINKNKN